MPYSDSTGDATEWFAARLEEQRSAHDGCALRSWAAEVLARLPDGAVTLVATSTEGCVLAGVVASMRSAPTTWRRLVFGQGMPDIRNVVVVEPIMLGAGMLQLLRDQLPEAVIVHGLAAPPERVASAA